MVFYELSLHVEKLMRFRKVVASTLRTEVGPTQAKVLLLGLKNFSGLWIVYFKMGHGRLSLAGPKTNPDMTPFKFVYQAYTDQNSYNFQNFKLQNLRSLKNSTYLKCNV